MLVEKGGKIDQFKIAYYLRFISRTIQHMGKENTINIKSLRTAPDFANCPETYCALGDKDKLYTVLLDSGAQSSILPWDVFQELGISSDKITKIRHCLNLQGTTGIHENAIYGSLTINCFCMLKKKKENGKSFGRSKITFMVCSPKVKIEKIIMGSPWLKYPIHLGVTRQSVGCFQRDPHAESACN